MKAVRSITLLGASLVLHFVVSPSQATANSFPAANRIGSCACHDDGATIEITGLGTFTGQFDGSISVLTGTQQTEPDGRVTIPLILQHYKTVSTVQGIGRTVLMLNPSQSVPASSITQNTAGIDFPATQTMRLPILMSIEAQPGRTFRSIGYGSLQATTDSFPPRPGTMYVLQAPLDFEDTANPGPVAARITSVHTRIVSSTMQPAPVVPAWRPLTLGMLLVLLVIVGLIWVGKRQQLRLS
jgi:hypothetical protein